MNVFYYTVDHGYLSPSDLAIKVSKTGCPVCNVPKHRLVWIKRTLGSSIALLSSFKINMALPQHTPLFYLNLLNKAFTLLSGGLSHFSDDGEVAFVFLS